MSAVVTATRPFACVTGSMDESGGSRQLSLEDDNMSLVDELTIQ